MPKIALVKGILIFFWVGENGEPIHVHAVRGKPSENSAKFWLTKSGGCLMANNAGRLTARDLKIVEEYVVLNHTDICSMWRNVFESEPKFIR